jgi:hypothetical protein
MNIDSNPFDNAINAENIPDVKGIISGCYFSNVKIKIL